MAAGLMELFRWVSEVEIWSVLQDLAELGTRNTPGSGKVKIGQG